MNTLRVFADFHNADAKDRVRLNCAGTVADLERQKTVLRNGRSVIIYSEELEVEGIVHYSEEEKLWTAIIDWDAIREVESILSQIPYIYDVASSGRVESIAVLGFTSVWEVSKRAESATVSGLTTSDFYIPFNPTYVPLRGT